LHNELIPELPYALKIKMAYHAAKGMHFLHSSGIVHRDLKSLNLLLDNKWNVKVSDFGLTKFRDELKKGGAGGHQMQGSVHWMAPEVRRKRSAIGDDNQLLVCACLCTPVGAERDAGRGLHSGRCLCLWFVSLLWPEPTSVLTAIVQCQNAGIILWELFTREQPYAGLRYVVCIHAFVL
jgi:serine/threonine protein kinase